MKSIQLRSGLILNQETTTQDLIKIVLNNPPDGGFQYKDYKERARIENAMDKVEPANEGNSYPYFQLEDRDYDNLAKLVKYQKWNVRDPFVIDFLDQFYQDK